MTPFHNMAKYRELQRTTSPPLIPFFPIIKKDLTFLYDGNESQVSGLVNFEKLRMLSQQIRVIKNYCQHPIMVRQCEYGYPLPNGQCAVVCIVCMFVCVHVVYVFFVLLIINQCTSCNHDQLWACPVAMIEIFLSYYNYYSHGGHHKTGCS